MQIYLVGGAVRDERLGLPVSERDWVVVGATAEEMLDLGYRQVGRDFPVFLHPESKEEYALARTERKSAPGHQGFEVHADPSVTLEEDLQRRDLTINAMAQDQGGELIDPYGGAADLADRTLRHVSDAFSEDPLRVLRVARFVARLRHLDFTVADSTLALMTEMTASGELDTLAAERVWQEFEKALLSPAPAAFIETLASCGADSWLLPGLPGTAEAASRLARAAAANENPEVRFACLFDGVTPAATRESCQRLKPPRRYQDAALVVAELSGQLDQRARNSAEQRLALLEAADAFRRPERFERLLDCWLALNPEHATSAHRWRRDLADCSDIDTSALAELNLKGPAAGEHIRGLRLAALENGTD